MQHSSFQREGQETTWGQIKGTTEAHQDITWGQIKGRQALHTPWSLSATPPLNHCYKTPHQIPPTPMFGTHNFEGQEVAVSPFAWQSNKAILFYFTWNSASKIWFSTDAQRLSFRHWYFLYFPNSMLYHIFYSQEKKKLRKTKTKQNLAFVLGESLWILAIFWVTGVSLLFMVGPDSLC